MNVLNTKHSQMKHCLCPKYVCHHAQTCLAQFTDQEKHL